VPCRAARNKLLHAEPYPASFGGDPQLLAFAEAVSAIERFLVPFECWSMLDYGLYGDEDGAKKLSTIDSETKASALLRLLDLTVGTSDGVVVPYDLTDALDQIRLVAPHLVNSPHVSAALDSSAPFMNTDPSMRRMTLAALLEMPSCVRSA
jgi:hypothetical protein